MYKFDTTVTAADFSLSKFKANIGNIVRPNFFGVIITGVKTTGGEGLSIPGSLSFRCEQAEFPGKSLATLDDSGPGGPALKLAYDNTYGDLTLTVICSDDYAERIFFEKWMDKIVHGPGEKGGLIGLYDDYAKGVVVEVIQYDEKADAIATWKCEHVYPIAISPMTASWAETNTYQRFTVTLHYRHYYFSK